MDGKVAWIAYPPHEDRERLASAWVGMGDGMSAGVSGSYLNVRGLRESGSAWAYTGRARLLLP